MKFWGHLLDEPLFPFHDVQVQTPLERLKKAHSWRHVFFYRYDPKCPACTTVPQSVGEIFKEDMQYIISFLYRVLFSDDTAIKVNKEIRYTIRKVGKRARQLHMPTLSSKRKRPVRTYFFPE